MKAIIIDDELAGREVLEAILGDVAADLTILARCENLEDGIAAIRTHKPDVVFLDIEMPGASGLEIGKFLDPGEFNFELVFVTAYSQYAVQAFRLSALDYLLKPVRSDLLRETVDRVRDNMDKKNTFQQLQIFQRHLQLSAGEQTEPRVCIPTNEGKFFYEIRNLLFFRAEGAYTKIYAEKSERNKLLVGKNIRYFEEMLEPFSFFMRVHRSYLVNLRQISRLEPLSVWIGETEIPVSKAHRVEIEARIKSV